MNNYLITGGLGFIGSHLTFELLKDPNNRVWIIDDGTNAAWNPRRGRVDYEVHVRDLLVQLMGGYEVDNDSRNPSLVCISGDCAHNNILLRIRNGHFSAVYHMAADVSVVKSIKDPLTVLDNNVKKTLAVAAACAAGKTRLIFSSSAAVYGNLNGDEAIKETSSTQPTNPYGLSKLTCENWLRAYKDLYGLDYVSLRYFNVYGPRQKGGSPYSGVIGNWVHSMHYKKPLVIYGDGEQTRDFVHVQDIASANIKALDIVSSDVRTFNICNEKETRLNEIIKIFSKMSKDKFNTRYETQRSGEVKNSIGSNVQAKIYLDWEPTISLREGLANTMLWRGV